jgi:predicted ABC-type ATPase
LPPDLHLIAGPNGSGKSTFVAQVRAGTRTIDYSIPSVINPDEIARRLNPSNPDAVAAPAAREALRQRTEALASRESFSIETTLSGKSELRLIDLARTADYQVSMTYLALESPEDNVKRVKLRELEERRTVPGDDVRRRYDRSLDVLGTVVDRLDRVDLFDNTGTEFAYVATLERGRVISLATDIPAWVERALPVQLELAREKNIALEIARYGDAFRRIYNERLGVDPPWDVRIAETLDNDLLRSILAEARKEVGLPALPAQSKKLDMPGSSEDDSPKRRRGRSR